MEGFYIIAIAPSLNAWLLHMFPLHLSLLKYLLNDVKKACIWNFRVNDSQTRCLVNRFGIPPGGGGGRTLGISGWECAAGTLEPLTYTRASLAEFCFPVLE